MNILITGASTGIGFSFAQKLAENKKNRLILVSQNKKRQKLALEKLAKINRQKIFSLTLDLKSPLSIKKIDNFLKKNRITVDFLINNAGIGFFGAVEEMSFEEVEDILDVNIKVLTQLTRLVIPAMKKKKAGKIINVASTAAFQPIPYFSVYAASKSYVLNFTEGLARELEEDNIKVLALCPGATETSFFARASSKNEIKEGGLFKLKQFMQPQEVVEEALAALEKDKRFKINGVNNFFMASLARIFPRNLVSKIGKDLIKKSLEKKKLK